MSASFPAGDSKILKRKLVYWAGNFSSSLLIDRNGYKNFDPSCECLLAAGELDSLTISSAGVFASLENFFNKKKDWLFGYLSYDLKNETEPKVFNAPDSRFDGIGFPLAHFFQPKHLVELKDGQLFIQSTEDPEKIFKAINDIHIEDESENFIEPLIQTGTSRKDYLKTVSVLKEHIANGDLYEVNLCQEFFIENFSFNPRYLFNRLNEINPAPFACFLRHNNRYLLCTSPERFLKKQGNKLISQPIKGTIRRSDDEDEDDLLKEKLRHDPKEQSENVMIVDLVRNDLARSAVPGSVKVDELFGIYSFPKVHQMISTISSTLRDEVHFIDALKYAFPMGSMTGAPKIMAMQLIDRYEKTKRGLFSGTVGFITPDGDLDFNVVIRSLLYNDETKYLSFQTGSAITIDSIPEKEYAECLLKAKALMESLGSSVMRIFNSEKISS